MTTFESLLATIGGVIATYMTMWFIVALVRKRNDVADIAWGLGFVLAAAVALVGNNEPSYASIIAVGLTGIWGFRLATHIYLRNRGKGEDFRYAQWRKDWGKFFLIRSYLQVFLLQGLFMFVVVLPVVLTAGLGHTVSISAWVAAGIVTWIFGFYFEALGDYQLGKFVSNPANKGKIMDRGVWQYSRHPNYFGEVTQWWGLWLILVATSLPFEYKVIGLAGPVTITTLILFVSGVPMLEKKYADNPAYQKYAKRTNKFFPWSPKR